jgi:2-(1,2-epoxy-1,2-dihydrophenyl)acetyl-CoA isomerase
LPDDTESHDDDTVVTHALTLHGGCATVEEDELIERTDGAVTSLVLNRPDCLNALSAHMGSAIVDAIARAASDPMIRVVVLKGNGRAFSAGGDVKQMARDIADGRPAAYFGHPLATIHAAALAIRKLEKPVIASLHGAVAGAGLNLALCCDYRIAADNAVFIQAFSNIGLAPDTGATYLLPRLVGLARATELLFEGRAVDAPEAEVLGFVNRVVALDQLDAAVDALAHRLAARPTRALGLTKRLLQQGAGRSFEAQLSAEHSAQQTLGARSPDYAEGVRAFLEKRAPHFTGR